MQHPVLLWDSDLQAAASLEIQKAAGVSDLEFFAVTFRGVPVCPHRTARMRLTGGSEAEWRSAAAVSKSVWGKLVPGIDAADHKSAKDAHVAQSVSVTFPTPEE